MECFSSFPGEGEAWVAIEEVVGVFHRPGPGEEEGGLGVGPVEEVGEKAHGPRIRGWNVGSS